ncbi:hypothetical protein [uncultured Kordia sp.]|uniref:hypothetical protein n=1 Tax=uncultured Kordia sp. TaxID=507699 RepID=UPI0026122988|nr:hypothetical protein [uncultured Kordia sp.]
MKKKNIKNLMLNKKSIISFYHSVNGGHQANTCEGPCQGGTSCCQVKPIKKTRNTGMFSGCENVC